MENRINWVHINALRDTVKKVNKLCTEDYKPNLKTTRKRSLKTCRDIGCCVTVPTLDLHLDQRDMIFFCFALWRSTKKTSETIFSKDINALQKANKIGIVEKSEKRFICLFKKKMELCIVNASKLAIGRNPADKRCSIISSEREGFLRVYNATDRFF